MAQSPTTLVISSGPGIGAAIGDRMRARGAPVLTLDQSIDLTDAESVGRELRAIAAPGEVDLVVFAALEPASFHAGPITALDEQLWDAAAERPMRAAFVVLQQVHAVIADGGRVVLVLPTVAATGVAELVPLCTAVEAIRVMAKAVARRWGARSITVNTIEVDLRAVVLGDDDGDGRAVPAVPVLGQPSLPPGSAVDDVVGLVDMLATRAAGAITGALLVADRGTVMQP